MNTYLERALREALVAIQANPTYAPDLLATEPMQAIARVVEAAVVLERFMRSDTEDWTPGLDAVGDFYAAIAALEEVS